MSNLERKSVIPKNAEELRRFVEAFDSRISPLGETEGLNFVDFVADFTSASKARTFQNTSAVAAALHYSAHLVHLVAFVDGLSVVHLWIVRDSIPSVFDFLVAVQEEHAARSEPSAVAKEFLRRCIELALVLQKGDRAAWISQRFAIIATALEKGHVDVAAASVDFERSLSLAFLCIADGVKQDSGLQQKIL